MNTIVLEGTKNTEVMFISNQIVKTLFLEHQSMQVMWSVLGEKDLFPLASLIHLWSSLEGKILVRF